MTSMRLRLHTTDCIILSLVAAKLLLHLFTNANYGLHRDEYLYLDQGNHLAWGYMEVPPFIGFLAFLLHGLGASPFLVRLLPTLAGVLSIFLIGRATRQLGGDPWAVAFAGLAFLMAPALLRGNSLFQPVPFNQFFWLLSAYWLVQLIRSEDHRYWWALGATAGLGVLNKYTIGLYLLALFVGILASPQRRWLKTPHPYIGLGIALLLAAPHLLWQYAHNFPALSHLEELREEQLVNVRPLNFLLEQLLFFQAGTLVWGAGLVYLLFSKRAAPYRPLGLASLLTVGLLLLLRGKAYYTIGSYTILLVFGGLALERYLKRKVWKWTIAALLTLGTLPLLPLSLYLLPNAELERYCHYLVTQIGLDAPMRWEDGKVYALPQDYADMNGWEEVAADIAEAYHDLDPEEQDNCLVFGGSYGHAGAINYYRSKYGLPKECYSMNSSYKIWIPREVDFDCMLLATDVRLDESDWFEEVQLLDSIDNPYARDPGYIYLRRQPKTDLREVWREWVAAEKAPYNFD